MGSFLFSTASFIVAISVLVAIHEYGHYIVGRWTGMKVLRFSIGFGKPIWSRVAGPDRTEYCISAIPLGGYVRFLDSREGPVDAADEGRAFNQRPIWARIAVLVAGPAFNFVFAIFAYWALFVYGVPTVTAAVGEVAAGSYAEAAGLETGERIVAVDGETTRDWESALVAMLGTMVADGRIPLTLEDHNGRQRNALLNVGDNASRLTEPGMLFDGLGFQPWRSSDAAATVGEVSADSAAARAGLLPGDTITAIDGEPINRFLDLVNIVSVRAERKVAVEFERGGRVITVDTVLGSTERDGKSYGLLGVTAAVVTSDYFYMRKYGVLESVGHAAERTWSTTKFTLSMLGRMLTGDVSIKNISGPINIAQFAGESAENGLDYYLGFLAIVSISLGVLNLLPVPVLDGGQIVYQLVELVKGSPLSERAQIMGQQVGIFALLILMSFAFYNDIARILG
ncbi:MAG: RIP metalloprotease RseP [Woeseiaceae bacterium]